MSLKTFIAVPFFLMLCLWQYAGAQVVWPGDVNNNGVVNGVDALYLGWAFGATGPARAETDTDWAPQPAPTPWGQVFPNGLNYYFADCDGNGVVDLADLTEAIDDNYLETHGTFMGDGFANAAPGQGPRLRLVPSTTSTTTSSEVQIALFLGDADFPIQHFYGINLQLSIGMRQGGDYDNFEFEAEANGWFDPTGAESFVFFQEGDDRADLTISRTNQQPLPQGQGLLGSFSVIMEDIIVGLERDTFFIRIDSVFLITDQLVALPVQPDSSQIVVTDTALAAASSANPSDGPVVYPNPARRTLHVEAHAPIAGISLHRPTGQPIAMRTRQGQNAFTTQCWWPDDTPPGLYFLHILTEGGGYVRKVILQP